MSRSDTKCRRAHQSAEDFLDVPEAPTYYPTEEEFSHPLEYLRKVRDEAAHYGICRIVPPASWAPPFALDKDKFSFKTRIQAVNELQSRESAAQSNDEFLKEYLGFLEARGIQMKRWPVFGGRECDLNKLFCAVQRRGGYDEVTNNKQWKGVAELLGAPESHSSASFSIRELYKKHLLAFEEHRNTLPETSQQQHCTLSGLAAAAGVATTPESVSKQPRLPKRETSSDGKACNTDATENAVLEAFLELETRAPSEMQIKVEPTVVKAEAEAEAGQYDAIVGLASALEGQTVPALEQYLEKINEMKCQRCNCGGHEDKMIICDRCDKGYHLYCLSPPLDSVPEDDWVCPACMTKGREPFGFEEGFDYNLQDFAAMARAFKVRYFGSEEKAKKATIEQIEAAFWKIVGTPTTPVRVVYGADLDISTYGSGFFRSSDDLQGNDEGMKYARSAWNVNNWPTLEGSMLRNVDDNIPGVMVPWLYIGMIFSCFCWHFEDHFFYSVNYHHWGDPKVWYGVPGASAEAFEAVMKSTMPDLFAQQPDLLFQLVTMLSPKTLQEHDVPVYKAVQEPGNFVITFPRAYHGGFNAGFNCAEAVNFAPADWLPHGTRAVERYRLYRRPAVLSHEELVFSAAEKPCSKETAAYVAEQLERVLEEERYTREKVYSEGTRLSGRLEQPAGEEPECLICKYFVHQSAVTCTCRPGLFACLHHSQQICDCSGSARTMLYRYSIDELEQLRDKMKRTAKPCDAEKREPHDKYSLSGFDLQKKERFGRSKRWLLKARALLDRMLNDTVDLNDIQDCIQEAGEFIWGGREYRDARQMTEKLSDALDWHNNASDLLTRSRIVLRGEQTRPTLKELVDAIATGKDGGPGASVSAPLMPRLISLMHYAEDCRRKVVELFHKAQVPLRSEEKVERRHEHGKIRPEKMDLAALQVLAAEYGKVPVELEDVDQLHDCIDEASNWTENVRSSLPKAMGRVKGETPLSTLQKLLQQGDRLLCIPSRHEYQTLKEAVARSQSWADRAKSLLEKRGTLSECTALLQQENSLPAKVEERTVLEEIVSSAKKWQGRALDALASMATITMQDLQDLAEDGKSLKCEVPEVVLIESERKRRSWHAELERLNQGRPEVEELEALIETASANEVSDDVIELVNAKGRAERAHALAQRAGSLLTLGGSFEDFSQWVRESNGLGLRVDSMEEVSEQLAKARTWLDRAMPALRSSHSTRRKGEQSVLSSWQDVQDLIQEASTMPVRMKEAELLEQKSSSIAAWHEDVEAALKMPLPCLDDLGLLRERRQKLALIWEEGKGLYIELPLMASLKDKLALLDWVIGARCLIIGKDGLEPLVKYTELLQQFEGLTPVEGVDELVRSVQARVDEACKWEEAVANIQKRSSKANKATVKEAESLLSAAREIPVRLTGKDTLVILLARHAKLQRKVSSLLPQHSGSDDGLASQVQASRADSDEPCQVTAATQEMEGVPKLPEVEELMMLGKEFPLQIDGLKQVEELLEGVAIWRTEVYKMIRKGKASKETVMQLLYKLRVSARFCMEKLEGPHWVKAQESDSATFDIGQVIDVSLAKAENEEVAISTARSREGSIYCVCRMTSKGSVIGCDSCDDWFHYKCIGAKPSDASKKSYTCPLCHSMGAAVDLNKLFLHDEEMLERFVTSRPTLEQIHELVTKGRRLGCQVEECAILELVEAEVEYWADQVQRTVNTIWECAATETSTLPFTPSYLLGICKAAVGLEVKTSVVDELLIAFRLASWLRRHDKVRCADRLARHNLGRLRRDYEKLIANARGAAKSQLERVPAFQSVKKLGDDLDAWTLQAAEAVGDLTMPIEDVRKLIEGGQEFRVDLSKEIGELEERCVLYCVCCQPYDDSRAMIECDGCKGWFHYPCINLPEPDGEHDAPEHFECPSCEAKRKQELSRAPMFSEDERIQAEFKRQRLEQDVSDTRMDVFTPLRAAMLASGFSASSGANILPGPLANNSAMVADTSGNVLESVLVPSVGVHLHRGLSGPAEVAAPMYSNGMVPRPLDVYGSSLRDLSSCGTGEATPVQNGHTGTPDCAVLVETGLPCTKPNGSENGPAVQYY